MSGVVGATLDLENEQVYQTQMDYDRSRKKKGKKSYRSAEGRDEEGLEKTQRLREKDKLHSQVCCCGLEADDGNGSDTITSLKCDKRRLKIDNKQHWMMEITKGLRE